MPSGRFKRTDLMMRLLTLAGALEATLGTLGYQGNTLGKRLSRAIGAGVLTQYDKKIADWLSSDRVAKGDSHPEGLRTRRADAWLSVHVTGALILCLAEGEDRGKPMA